MNCSICDLEIAVTINGWDKGHNAEPVTDGRCCGSCNVSVVLPTRIKNIIDGSSPKRSNKKSSIATKEDTE